MRASWCTDASIVNSGRTIVGLRPSFSSQVRFGEPGAPVLFPPPFLSAEGRLRPESGFWKNVRTKRTMRTKWCRRRRRAFGSRWFRSHLKATSVGVRQIVFRGPGPMEIRRQVFSEPDGDLKANLVRGGRARNEAARPFLPGPRKTQLSSFASPGLGVPLP
jgi:hypothetical protein